NSACCCFRHRRCAGQPAWRCTCGALCLCSYARVRTAGKNMRLTTMTDYAIRLLMYVGRHPDRLCTIAEIARAYDISEPHLMKITHRLAQRGWLETIRGKNGGMRLAMAPQDINLGAVVRDTEN